MSIRNAAKALIEKNGKLLLVTYRNGSGETCYTIPGGGQNIYETLEETVIRECLEETGYQVSVTGFTALYEEIVLDKAYQKMHPDYAHKIFHIFHCCLESDIPQLPAEQDVGQTGCEWVDVGTVGMLNLYPLALREYAAELMRGQGPMFLGTRMLKMPE